MHFYFVDRLDAAPRSAFAFRPGVGAMIEPLLTSNTALSTRATRRLAISLGRAGRHAAARGIDPAPVRAGRCRGLELLWRPAGEGRDRSEARVWPGAGGAEPRQGGRSGAPPRAGHEALRRPLRRRAPHHAAARQLRLRPRQRLPARHLVVLPRPPVLQLGAGLAALPRGHRRDDGHARSSARRAGDLQRRDPARPGGLPQPDRTPHARYGAAIRGRLPGARQGQGRRRPSAASPTRCRSARRRSPATSCPWPPRRTSTTPINGLTLLRYHVLASQPDVPVRSARHRRSHGRRGARRRSLLPRRAGLPARFAAARYRGDARGAGARRVARRAGPTGSGNRRGSRRLRRSAGTVRQPPDRLRRRRRARHGRGRARRPRRHPGDALRTRMLWLRCWTRRATRTWGIPSSSACSPS